MDSARSLGKFSSEQLLSSQLCSGIERVLQTDAVAVFGLRLSSGVILDSFQLF